MSTAKTTTAAKSKSTSAAPVAPSEGAAPATAVTPTVVDAPQPVILGPVMRKKELIALVVERSGIKKKDAKPVIESMLAVLGEAMADNRELVLPPFGKVKIQREKQLPNGRVMVVKVRQPSPARGTTADEPSDMAG